MRATFLGLGFVLATIAPTLALAAPALDCSDVVTDTVMGSTDGSDPFETVALSPYYFKAGDVLHFTVSGAQATGGYVTIAIGAEYVSFLSTTPTQSAPPLVLANDSNMMVIQMDIEGSEELTLSLRCSPPADLGQIGSDAARISGINGEMISELATAGLDVAFAGEDQALGYSGIVLDATPDALAQAGFSLWAGGKGLLTLEQADQWSGGQGVVAAGLNYRVDDRLVLGTFASLEAAAYRRDSADEDLGASGATLGALAAYRLDETWQVQIIGHASRLGYEVSSGTTTGAFDATRLVLTGSLTGTIPLSASIDFVPVLSLGASHESQAGYTDSSAVSHAAATFASANVSGGGKFMFYPESGPFAFSAGAYGSYRSDVGATAKVEVGTSASLGDAAQFSATAGVQGIGALPAATISGSLQGQF